MNLNEQQKQAVAWNGDLIVSAAAGAGKTTVLTLRVLRLIEDGVGLDEMLILTFTRAAAAEMKNRIERKLTEAEQAETDPEKKRRLQRQLLLCPNACISTIDSFCSSVVHRHYYRLDLAPAMGTVTNTEQEILFGEAFEAAAEEAATEAPAALRTLLRAFNGTDALSRAINKLHTFLCAQPDRDAWLEKMETDCREGRLTEAAEEQLLARCRRELEADINAFRLYRDRLNELAPVYDKYVQFADALLLPLCGALSMKDPSDYGEALSAVPVSDRIPKVRAREGEQGLCEQFKQCRDTLKKTVPEQAALFFAADEAETGNRRVTEIVEALLSLLRRTETHFSAAKLEKGKLDFADMEYYAVKLLSIPEVAEEYRNRFRTVIVDEYQDSNYLQEAILNRIRRPDGLGFFLVGDVKQSIYGFRMAVPDLFTDKSERYGRGEEGRRIDLNSNFRSSPEILAAVNSVFSRLMTAETGMLRYDDSQALHLGMDQPAGKAELVLIDCKETEDDDPDEELENAEAEAMFCVETIRRIMANETYTDRDKHTRPYRYSDFTVLLRSGTPVQKMTKIFTQEGIPCFAEAGKGYFESIEVQLFLNVLRIIDNRRQDIPLLSVMRSGVGDFSDEELIALRRLCPGKEQRILDCLLAAAAKEPDGKADRFLCRIEYWRQRSLYMPTRELCSLLLDETGLLLEMSMLPGGRQREANLNEVLNIAGEYDNSGAFGLHGFLRFADKAREKDKIGSAPTISGNVVRFMSVHKSKGLEFPVVFYCDLARKFNTDDATADLLLNSELGIGLKYTDEQHIKRVPRLHKLLAKRIAAANREEEMRVLYVGMTRAERKLYMVGSVKDASKTLDKLPAYVSAAELRGAPNAFKWLLLTREDTEKPALPMHIVDKSVLIGRGAAIPKLDKPDPEAVRALAHRLERTYPWPAPAGVPNKTSATSLAGREKVYAFSEDPFREREAGSETEASALQHGTDIHALLEKMPLSNEGASAREEMLSRLSEKDRGSLRWFLGTELFRRMQASPLCRRELPFTAAMESGTLPGLAPGEQVLLQGVIDCCFTEGDAYVVLDYKTDSFRGRTAEEQAETHRDQIELYARVLSELTGKPVKELYVVFITEKTAVRL